MSDVGFEHAIMCPVVWHWCNGLFVQT